MISTLADDNQLYLASPRVGGAAEEPREITGFTNFGQGPSFSFPDFHIDGKKHQHPIIVMSASSRSFYRHDMLSFRVVVTFDGATYQIAFCCA